MNALYLRADFILPPIFVDNIQPIVFDMQHHLMITRFPRWNQAKIEAKCKCKSILFPTRVNISNYELPTCSFVKQAVCASKMVKLFEYNTCDCLPECHAERYEIVSHQYGSLSLKDHRIMVEGEFKTLFCIFHYLNANIQDDHFGEI